MMTALRFPNGNPLDRLFEYVAWFIVVTSILLSMALMAVGQACGPQGCDISNGWQQSRPVKLTAPTTVSQDTPEAIVRVGCEEGQGVRSYGSGAIVYSDKIYSYVLTCWHTFRDGGRPFVLVNGRGYWAGVMQQDIKNDLVLLKIARVTVVPLRIAPSVGTRGQRLTASGFGSGRFQRMNCTFQEINSDGVLIAAGVVRPGDSGGPILDASGQIVGVVWGSGSGIVTATCLRPVRNILQCIFSPPVVLVTPPKVIPMPDRILTPFPQLPQRPPVSMELERMIVELREEVQALRNEVKGLKNINSLPGPAGPMGLPGPSGANGKDGIDGKDGKDGGNGIASYDIVPRNAK